MPILQILIVLILVGALLYVMTLLPIDATIKKIIQIVAIVLVVIWILMLLWPMLGSVGTMHMGR